MASKTERYLEEIRGLTGLKNAILCGITVTKKDNSADFFLVTDKTYSAMDEARAKEFHGDYRIFASDIDPHAIEIAREKAMRAGVADIVKFSVADAMSFDRKTERGIIVTNPPYGERIMERREAEGLYAGFGRAYLASENWKLYLLSSHTEFERTFGKTADKKRKLYNGMIKCDLFMYL